MVELFFNSTDFTGPTAPQVVAQIDHDSGRTINDCSRLWLGRLTAPATGKVTFSAEANDG